MSGFMKARGIPVLIRVVTGATMTFASPIELWHTLKPKASLVRQFE